MVFNTKNCFTFLKQVNKDDRGYFLEEFNSDKDILNFKIKQISESFSKKYTFRGFHFEIKNKMNKIICVKKGHAKFFCLNINSKNVYEFDLKQIEKNDSNQTYLYVPHNYAVSFFTHKPTIVRYFHDATRSENNRTINYMSVNETKKFKDKIKYISKNDLNAIDWDKWIDTQDYKEIKQ